MGLAPYGKPIYVDKILKIIDIKDDGTFRVNQKYFNYATGLTMTSKKFHDLFNHEPRKAETEELTQFHMDIAASIQKVTEDIILKLAKSIKEEYKIENLCLAGGVALNCVANGKIMKNKIFKNIWVQPAAGDAGGSLGAALAMWYVEEKNLRNVNEKDEMNGSYLGPEYSQIEIENELKKLGAKFEILSNDEIIKKTSKQLSLGNAIGWFQDRMEFGPRSLGARSILADPRKIDMQKRLNLKIKFRESFRPFAPSILKEDVDKWFDIENDSPYMLMVAEIKESKQIKMTDIEKTLFGIKKLDIKRSEIPAVTHVDYSSRIQTVDEDSNYKFFRLIKEFKEITGCPVLVNTSFNVRGEPIVNTPKDAFECFMNTELDILAIGNCFLHKKDQMTSDKKDFNRKVYLD